MFDYIRARDCSCSFQYVLFRLNICVKYLLSVIVLFFEVIALCLSETSMRGPRGAFYHMYFCFAP